MEMYASIQRQVAEAMELPLWVRRAGLEERREWRRRQFRATEVLRLTGEARFRDWGILEAARALVVAMFGVPGEVLGEGRDSRWQTEMKIEMAKRRGWPL
jgi:hypothetical protein